MPQVGAHSMLVKFISCTNYQSLFIQYTKYNFAKTPGIRGELRDRVL